MSGIYKIYCKETNKYYIGQSVNVESRLKTHLNELKNNKHINQELQSDFNSYGEDSFIFEKIKDSEEQFLNMFEKYYMEYYDSLENGYNVVPMNNLVRREDKKNDIEALKDIDPIEVPLIAGDIYAYEIFLDAQLIEEAVEEEESALSGDIKTTVNSISNFLQSRHIGFWRRNNEILELELRRRFNRIGIKSVELGDIENPREFLETKICTAKIWTDKDFIEIKIKCTK
jgi:hypothetical protein